MIEVMSADMVCVVRNVMADTLGSSETIVNPPREYTEARKNGLLCWKPRSAKQNEILDQIFFLYL